MLPTGVRVVIADHHTHEAQALAQRLRVAGHHVHLAHEHTRAVSLGELMRPDAMIIDLELPAIGGDELARQLRLQPWGTALQLIALADRADEQEARRRHDAGFDEHLQKPADFDEVLRLITPQRKQVQITS